MARAAGVWSAGLSAEMRIYVGGTWNCNEDVHNQGIEC
jgi:hypothetical protein